MRRPARAMPRAGRALPAHVRFLLGHAAIGILIAFLFVGSLLALDVAGLRALMLRGGDGVIALALLLFGSSVTFGSAAMGAAVMGLGTAPRPPRAPPARATLTQPLREVPVRAGS